MSHGFPKLWVVRGRSEDAARLCREHWQTLTGQARIVRGLLSDTQCENYPYLWRNDVASDTKAITRIAVGIMVLSVLGVGLAVALVTL